MVAGTDPHLHNLLGIAGAAAGTPGMIRRKTKKSKSYKKKKYFIVVLVKQQFSID